MRRLFVKTQTELKNELLADVLDTGQDVWTTDAQVYRAINVAIQAMAGRVKIPVMHTIDDGFSVNSFDYVLPSHIGSNFIVQARSDTYPESGWYDITHYTVEPSATGRVLRLIVPPYSADARIVWYTENSPVPTTTGTMVTELLSDGEALWIDPVSPSIAPVGFVKVKDATPLHYEYIGYGGLTYDTNTEYVGLTNLSRGLFETAAADHSDGTETVEWCVVVDDMRLWEFISDRAIAHLHNMLLHRGTQEDRLHHEKMMGYHMQRADGFGRRTGYVPAVGPKIRINDRVGVTWR